MGKSRTTNLYIIETYKNDLALSKEIPEKDFGKVIKILECNDSEYFKITRNTRLSKDGICYLEGN